MRKYEPIWNKLKEEGSASLAAHPLLHPRIIKAVTKEKWMDNGFKLSSLPYHYILSYVKEGGKLTFRLTKHLSESIGVADV